MKNEIKSGEKIVDDFFKEIEKIPEVQKEIALLFIGLHKEGKFTEINIKNGLQKIREKNETKN